MDDNFDAKYDEYQKEAEEIMLREKTSRMTRQNEADPSDPKTWVNIGQEETEAFWEKAKCLTI